MFLFTFPEAISLDLCRHWLDASDIQHLDTAYCSKTDRDNILNLIKHPHFVMETNEGHQMFGRFLWWISIRNIKLKKLIDLSVEQSEVLPKIDPSELETIEMANWDSGRAEDINQLISFINSTKKLKSLTLDHGSIYLWNGRETRNVISTAVLNGLTELLICTDEHVSEALCSDSVTYLAAHCRNLDSFMCLIPGSDFHGADFAAFFSANQNLRGITLWYTEETGNSTLIVPLIANLCPNLINLSLDHCANADSLLLLMQKCPHIKSVNISSEFEYSANHYLCVHSPSDNLTTNLSEFIRLYCRVNAIYFEDFQVTTDILGSISYSTQLKSFHFKTSGDLFTKEDLKHVIEQCKQLTTFHLKHPGFWLTGENLMEIFATPSQLTELSITKNHVITSQQLIEIVKSIPTLTRLGCADCFKVLQKELKPALKALKVELVFKKFDIFELMAENGQNLILSDDDEEEVDADGMNDYETVANMDFYAPADV